MGWVTVREIKPQEEISKKNEDPLERQRIISPIVVTINERISCLENLGVASLIDEIGGIYGEERIWEPPTPWENYSRLGTRLSLDPDFEYPGKHAQEQHDLGFRVYTKVLFSKISKGEDLKELSLADLEMDMDVNGGSDFSSRRNVYLRASRKPKKLGLLLGVAKRLFDERELEGVDRSRFSHELSTSLCDVVRGIEFCVFEDRPNELIIKPGGFSKERKFNLQSRGIIEDMRNFLGEVIAQGGDVSAISHTENLPFVQAPRGPLLLFK